MEKMQAVERFHAIFEKGQTDRPAVINPTSIANVECMQATKAFFPTVHTNGEKMAALAATGHDLLGFDSVAPYFSVQQEAAALGCKVNWGQQNTMPTVGAHPVQEPDDFKMPADFLDKAPIKAVLTAIRLLKKKLGNDVVVIGKVIGPWTLAYHLRGVQDFLIETTLEAEKVQALLHAFKEVPLKFAFAQMEAGADAITWADHATSDLVSAKAYKRFLFPIHRECMGTIKKGAARRVPMILHTCGNTLDRVQLFSKTGFDAFHFDSKNDPAKMLELVEGRLLLTGCVNNPEVLLNGKEGDVRKQVNAILDQGIRLVSPECAIPVLVKSANLKAIAKTVKKRTGRINA